MNLPIADKEPTHHGAPSTQPVFKKIDTEPCRLMWHVRDGNAESRGFLEYYNGYRFATLVCELHDPTPTDPDQLTTVEFHTPSTLSKISKKRIGGKRFTSRPVGKIARRRWGRETILKIRLFRRALSFSFFFFNR